MTSTRVSVRQKDKMLRRLDEATQNLTFLLTTDLGAEARERR